MIDSLRSTLPILFAALTASFLIACGSSGPKVETTVEEGPGSIVVVRTVRTQATVLAIDATQRTVRLKPKHADERTIKVHEGAINFENVRVGDEVHLVLIEETAISLVRGGAPASIGAKAAVKLAPAGGKPGVILADAIEATATVVAIDGHDHSVTLEFLDGQVREIDVSRDRDLTQVALGDSVRVQLTNAIAISVVKP